MVTASARAVALFQAFQLPAAGHASGVGDGRIRRPVPIHATVVPDDVQRAGRGFVVREEVQLGKPRLIEEQGGDWHFHRPPRGVLEYLGYRRAEGPGAVGLVTERE